MEFQNRGPRAAYPIVVYLRSPRSPAGVMQDSYPPANWHTCSVSYKVDNIARTGVLRLPSSITFTVIPSCTHTRGLKRGPFIFVV